MKKIVNNPHLTVIEQTSMSFPTCWLKHNNLLKGEILDFGCGFGFDTDQLKEQGFSNENCEIYEYQHNNQLIRDNINCPFCDLASKVELISETTTAVAFLDIFPVNPGHTLIVPKRHIANYFELTIHEQRALWLVVNRCKMLIQKRFNPDGFNVGINVGEIAGQSIFHVHIHLIPRYKGDVENPRGGVRGAISSKQSY